MCGRDLFARVWFGGAALGLPLLLFVHNDPRLWLPISSVQLLFFRLNLVYPIAQCRLEIFAPLFCLHCPTRYYWRFRLAEPACTVAEFFIYSITLFYGFMWLFNRNIASQGNRVDKLLLIIGGYVAGTSLTGALLMVAVYMRNVSKE